VAAVIDPSPGRNTTVVAIVAEPWKSGAGPWQSRYSPLTGKRGKYRKHVKFGCYRGFFYRRVSPVRLKVWHPDGLLLGEVAGMATVTKWVDEVICNSQIADKAIASSSDDGPPGSGSTPPELRGSDPEPRDVCA
jgi:hypothetical protein